MLWRVEVVKEGLDAAAYPSQRHRLGTVVSFSRSRLESSPSVRSNPRSLTRSSPLMLIKIFSRFFSALAFIAFAAAESAPHANSVLWYAQPARSWMTEALPLGNGSLGAMLFGRTDTERIQFNANSLWTGDEKDTGHYQAFGDIFIQLNHAAPTDYRRELDISRAVQRVRYVSGGKRYERTALISHPAKVMVKHFGADQPGGYTGRLWLTDMHDAKITADGSRITAVGQLENGLEYEAQLAVFSKGGKLRLENSAPPSDPNPLAGVPGAQHMKLPTVSLVFEACDSLTLVLAADTNYTPDAAKGWRGIHPHAELTRRVDAVRVDELQNVFREHIVDYQSLFKRFQLSLGKSDPVISEKPTDQRLLAYTRDKTRDPQLEEMFVQYGRYLLISSSRGGLPANLQGLWNESNKPMWRSDYHSNINVQMNYWLAEPTNLSELHLPFLHYVRSQIPVYRERTREEYPKSRGWTVRTENGIHGGGSFVWNPPGSAWYALHFWEHYAFTGDLAYLRDIAYPVIKEVCQFWEDSLMERPDGTLVAPKGWSPEHGPVEAGVSYDQQIIHDLFTNYVEAADKLGLDRAYRDKIATMRGKLLKPKIGSWGQLQEWETDRDNPKDDHRHVSHLFALHPGRQISSLSPDLFQAAKVSLRARGDGGTGWSRAWKINFWARFRDGDHAYVMLRNLMTAVNNVGTDMRDGGGVYPNLFDAHPPFQIDGNFGAAAGVAEMLVQSQTGEIDLLPALPAAWSDGSVSGLCARGGFTLDLTWSLGRLASVRVTSTGGTSARLRVADQVREFSLRPGASISLDGSLKSIDTP
jgi:alpha-L-fucosidase 2